MVVRCLTIRSMSILFVDSAHFSASGTPGGRGATEAGLGGGKGQRVFGRGRVAAGVGRAGVAEGAPEAEGEAEGSGRGVCVAAPATHHCQVRAA